ncbi:HAD-IIIC family phosphatase [Oceanicoccus sagamiensis]|uniref:FkbH domain-containing protein n=1 Tax=Oceanicoccus sagamiensis TaxID=716816 RepID=A0A1X9NF86_9GAMM|nr:HAD-IIIC family phosphatase [Oceanicoccus sagamiensis]ARN73617.1 hypothetical protein BST96_05475 [Oceanicoccus sagamiensis]
MYEFEVDFKQYRAEDVPADVQKAFQLNTEVFKDVEAISPLLWEEHCTECAMPGCYSTCDIYEPRKDGKCRRFTHGISKIAAESGMLDYIVKVDFKRWGSLMATSKVGVSDLSLTQSAEKKIQWVEDIARNTPDNWLSIAGRRGISTRLARRYKKGVVEKLLNHSGADASPSHFVLEIFNPSDAVADITFTIRAEGGEKNSFPYQQRLKLPKGFHSEVIEYSEIAGHIDPDEKHFISFVPNQSGEDLQGTSLYFGYLGFVKKPAAENNLVTEKAHAGKTVKVVAWDLDNTLWDGILVEQKDQDSLQLKPDIEHIIKELDRRGIVNSIISKNDHENAMAKLQEFGIDDYFVFPEISWEPKSVAMGQVINNFNVNADTVVFIDDSPFEREEVASQHPLVRVFPETQYQQILNKDEFNPEVSVESGRRREFYKNQKIRNAAKQGFSGAYFDFVRSCEINLNLCSGKVEEIDRIHELIQRTNQMNFSGNRYNKSELQRILQSDEYDTYRLKCDDKFGDYGTVGFCVVENEKPQMIDLAFSCRVQSKRVEHAFIRWLLERYKAAGNDKFLATYNKTEKNTQSGKVFADIGFIEENPGLYSFSLSSLIEDEGLIQISFEG